MIINVTSETGRREAQEKWTTASVKSTFPSNPLTATLKLKVGSQPQIPDFFLPSNKNPG